MLPRMMRLLRHGVVFCVSRENVTSFHVLSFLWGCCVWLRPACTLVGVFHFCLGGGGFLFLRIFVLVFSWAPSAS